MRLLSRRALLLGVCLGSALLCGENGRNFSGSFQVRNVMQGATVQVDLNLKIFNYSGAPVQHAAVTVESRRRAGDSGDFQGSISDVSIPYRKSVDIRGTFTVPAREYGEWQRGALPYVVVTYTDASGQQVHNSVELVASILR